MKLTGRAWSYSLPGNGGDERDEWNSRRRFDRAYLREESGGPRQARGYESLSDRDAPSKCYHPPRKLVWLKSEAQKTAL